MIGIIVSLVMIGQTDSFDMGAKIRTESNKMLMGIYGVSYEVADILNGSNLSVDQAKHIFAQRQAAEARKNAEESKALKKVMATTATQLVKKWDVSNQSYQRIIDMSEIPESIASQMRGVVRQDIQLTAQLLDRAAGDKTFPKNMRTAARAHLNKAKAALDRLERVETK